tara:strand:- start:289 stop:483 length:195 start_codon:yes stop_codon:yes gene_type:complete
MSKPKEWTEKKVHGVFDSKENQTLREYIKYEITCPNCQQDCWIKGNELTRYYVWRDDSKDNPNP